MQSSRMRPSAPPLARALVLALALMLVLPGCAQLTATRVSSPQTNSESAPSASLSSAFEPVEEDGSLLLYAGDALANLQYPEYVLCDAGILLYETAYVESDGSTCALVLLDPATGQATASATLACEFITDIRQTDVGLMLCDSGLGTVTLLDDELAVAQQWSFEATYEYWYLGTSGSTVYQVGDGALCCVDLATGASETLLESSISLYGDAPLGTGAAISSVDEQTQLSAIAWLDLETGELSTPGFDEALTTLTCSDGTWLASVAGTDAATYILGGAEDAQVIELEEGSLSQVPGAEALLWESEDGLVLALYRSDGELAASCSFADSTLWHSGNYCAYSTVYEGFFLLVYAQETPQLLFWDAAASGNAGAADGAGAGTEAALTITPLAEYEEIPAGSAVSTALYERATELAETFGLEILIADQCPTAYEDFTAEQELDEELIGSALDTLEEALAAYPEGFIDQLAYDQVTGVRINICGTLTPTSDAWGSESYNGLTEESGNRYVMVLDASQLYPETVYHEISHIIDAKLAWDAYCRDDALFSEDAWAALNPEGFEYAYVYSGFEELEFEGDEWEYFIDAYSMVSPTEDRARIMEYAMAGYDSYFTEFEPADAKLRYYCACIRDAFDTTGWPETTAWEDVEG